MRGHYAVELQAGIDRIGGAFSFLIDAPLQAVQPVPVALRCPVDQYPDDVPAILLECLGIRAREFHGFVKIQYGDRSFLHSIQHHAVIVPIVELS